MVNPPGRRRERRPSGSAGRAGRGDAAARPDARTTGSDAGTKRTRRRRTDRAQPQAPPRRLILGNLATRADAHGIHGTHAGRLKRRVQAGMRKTTVVLAYKRGTEVAAQGVERRLGRATRRAADRTGRPAQRSFRSTTGSGTEQHQTRRDEQRGFGEKVSEQGRSHAIRGPTVHGRPALGESAASRGRAGLPPAPIGLEAAGWKPALRLYLRQTLRRVFKPRIFPSCSVGTGGSGSCPTAMVEPQTIIAARSRRCGSTAFHSRTEV